MDSDFEVSIEQEVGQIKMRLPHVVILGAGASRAVCINGDKNGKHLPLMSDFTEVVGLRKLLESWKINPDQNFEEIYSNLQAEDENDKILEIQNIVEEYFDQLELPDTPSIYDHLILSLRETDLIASFNWDPLLMQAYLRNYDKGLSLPKLAYLHGNIRAGYCEKDRTAGLVGHRCTVCGCRNTPTPLLYPIKAKNYTDNVFIRNEWIQLMNGLRNAFMITIFGYSGPNSDVEAITAMKEAWGNNNNRPMEQTCFLTTQNEDEVTNNWEPFIHTHHYEIMDNFYDSWIANHPRRTGEAYVNQYFEAKFINKNPIPKNLDFPDLWRWFEQFRGAESRP